MDDEPGLMDPYWSLVTLTLKEKDYDETLKTLRLIRDKFGVSFADLATLLLYKEFIETRSTRSGSKRIRAKPEKPLARSRGEARAMTSGEDPFSVQGATAGQEMVSQP